MDRHALVMAIYGRAKNYEPNSFGGPRQTGAPLWAPIEVAGLTGNHAPEHHRDDNDFVQAGDLYRLMSEAEKRSLIGNIAASLSKVSREDIIERSVAHFRQGRSGVWQSNRGGTGKNAGCHTERASKESIRQPLKAGLTGTFGQCIYRKENREMKSNATTQMKNVLETPTDLNGDAVVEISDALRKVYSPTCSRST